MYIYIYTHKHNEDSRGATVPNNGTGLRMRKAILNLWPGDLYQCHHNNSVGKKMFFIKNGGGC